MGIKVWQQIIKFNGQCLVITQKQPGCKNVRANQEQHLHTYNIMVYI